MVLCITIYYHIFNPNLPFQSEYLDMTFEYNSETSVAPIEQIVNGLQDYLIEEWRTEHNDENWQIETVPKMEYDYMVRDEDDDKIEIDITKLS
jgi:hypothetical protein